MMVEATKRQFPRESKDWGEMFLVSLEIFWGGCTAFMIRCIQFLYWVQEKFQKITKLKSRVL